MNKESSKKPVRTCIVHTRVRCSLREGFEVSGMASPSLPPPTSCSLSFRARGECECDSKPLANERFAVWKLETAAALTAAAAGREKAPSKVVLYSLEVFRRFQFVYMCNKDILLLYRCACYLFYRSKYAFPPCDLAAAGLKTAHTHVCMQKAKGGSRCLSVVIA